MQIQSQSIGEITYYSDQYEPQCPYCQQGEHSIQSDSHNFQSNHLMTGQAIRGRVVYVSPERIVSRKIIENNALSPSIFKQQQIMTPPRIATSNPQIINLQNSLTSVSPVLNQNQKISMQQSPILIHSQYIVPPQSFIQQQIPSVQQSSQDFITSKELQVSSLIQQELQSKQKELEEKLQNQTEEIQQSNQAYRQLQSALQEKKEDYENLKKAYKYQTQYSPTSQVPQYIEEFYQQSQIKEKKVVYTQEDIELFWKHRVFELEAYLYELWAKICKLKQQKEDQKKDDNVKIEQLQREVCQLEHILRLKSNSVVILKNKLNNLMYQFDPATEVTKQYDQKLQEVRQQVMSLNSKYQKVQEEIQVVQAQNQQNKFRMNDNEVIPNSKQIIQI
ncbi:unnamed protein product [Paramecium sonneborni]|uniref:Uncharacterized protein n=1 Tax=Paramecium sonneborni TaxID=65129 RepID=A0A8S1LDK8_9CILI|nr:unnamed protein product [Paramecium sonneborni]